MSSRAPIVTPPATKRATIVLLGNPNTGKSTLFNRLTGGRQRVGNYPGVTVAKKIGDYRMPGGVAEVIDLPGAYSLAASSPDERIAVDVLTGRTGDSPTVAICLVDATNIKRSLFLVCQAADVGIPLVIALNFMDEAARAGLNIRAETISERLGVPVIPISARRGDGMGKLREAISSAMTDPRRLTLPGWSAGVTEGMHLLASELATVSNHRLTPAELRRVLFDCNSAHLDLADIPEEDRIPLLSRVRKPIQHEGRHPLSIETVSHYAFLDGVLDETITRDASRKSRLTARIDHVLTHRVFGLGVFAVVMFVIFQAIYTLAQPLMEGVDGVFGALAELLRGWLAPLPMFQSLVCDGIIAGVGGVVIFLPQIFLLFFFISLLEDSGYMARAAFLMDKLFGWCGLNGKSFVPLLSSYACAVPGLLATRTIEDPKARLATILIAPLMSCSARLPVYLLMIGAFIAPIFGAGVAAMTLFAMQMIGLVVALPIAWIMNRWILRVAAQPFVLELPPYRLPTARDTFWRVWLGGREFLERAGSIILILSVVIWALLYFPHHGGDSANPEVQAAQIESSYLGQAGRFIQPVFAPAGFDWKITIGVLASFPAREVIVSTLGIIYHLGGETDDTASLADAMRRERWVDGPRMGEPVFTIPTVVAIMIFFAFCMQCSSTLVVIGREAGPRHAIWTFAYMTALAWVAAVIAYQVGSLILK